MHQKQSDRKWKAEAYWFHISIRSCRALISIWKNSKNKRSCSWCSKRNGEIIFSLPPGSNDNSEVGQFWNEQPNAPRISIIALATTKNGTKHSVSHRLRSNTRSTRRLDLFERPTVLRLTDSYRLLLAGECHIFLAFLLISVAMGRFVYFWNEIQFLWTLFMFPSISMIWRILLRVQPTRILIRQRWNQIFRIVILVLQTARASFQSVSWGVHWMRLPVENHTK